MEARKETPLFCLTPGGPVDRLQARLRLRRAESPLTRRRAIVAVLITWVPLAVLALVVPNRDADVSFFHDLSVQVRFLVIVPLLIIAEDPIGLRSHIVAVQFLESGLVGDDDAGDYDRAMTRGRHLIDSRLAEFAILALTAMLVWLGVRSALAEPAVFWFERATPQGTMLSPAGWFAWGVANPLFVFLLVRWLWRYLVWWWFLGRTARLNLRLTGTHPDRTGGLGFVTFHHSVFSGITFAVGCALSAMAAGRILNGLATLKEYQNVIAAITVMSIIFGVAPLFVFTPRLVAAKRQGWSRYSRLASEYVWRFEQKWTRGRPSDELLGSGDIQSLADIGGSFERMVAMRSFAIDRRIVFSFLFAAVTPMLPLLLTMFPLREIVSVLFKALV